MEAVRSQPRPTTRAWRLIAASALLLLMLIGGAAGYVVRLATAPTSTIAPTGSSSSFAPSDTTSGDQCLGLPSRLHGAAC
jgi:hypothetical protein